MNHLSLRRRTALIAAAVLTTAAFAAPAGNAALVEPSPGSPPPDDLATSMRLPKFAPGKYVVTLADKPLATYQGGVAGLKATKPAKGKKVDAASPDAKRYSSFLDGRHNQVAAKVGAKATRHYSTAVNAFAADLTSQQVSELSKTPGVVAVTPDQLHKALDDKKPADFLKLSGNRASGRRSAATPKPARASWSAWSTPASGRRALHCPDRSSAPSRPPQTRTSRTAPATAS